MHYNYALGSGPTVPGLVSGRISALRIVLPAETFSQMENEISGLLSAQGG
jgi:hypothetical protein